MSTLSVNFDGAVVTADEYEKFGIDNGLGWLIWFSIPKAVENLSYKEALDCIERNGGNASAFPPDAPLKAYHATVTASRDRGVTKAERTMIQPLPSVGNIVRHQVTIERIGTARDESKQRIEGLDYERDLFVQYHKDSNAVSFFKDGGASMSAAERTWGRAFVLRYETIRKHIKQRDVQLYIRAAHRSWHSISVRDMGGIYFVARDFTGEVQRMERIIADFGHGAQFLKTPIIDVQEWRENVASAFDESMETDLHNLTEELTAILAAAKKDGGAISKARLLKRLERYESVVGKAAMYEKLLNYRAKGVRISVEALSKKVKQALSGKMTGITPQESFKNRKEVEAAAKRAAREAAKIAKEKEKSLAKSGGAKKKAGGAKTNGKLKTKTVIFEVAPHPPAPPKTRKVKTDDAPF